MARASVLREIREAFEPGFRGSVTTHPGVRLFYDSGYDSIEHFLGNAYRSMLTATRRKKFREALGILFAEHVRKPGGSAASVLGVIATTRSCGQLTKVVRAFNDAQIAPDATMVLLYDLLATLKGAGPSESTYRVLRQLVDGPKFDVGYAIEALQMELECHPKDCHAILRRYAPMVCSLCRKVERTKKRDERDGLRFAFAQLQAVVDRLRLVAQVHADFDEFGVPHGKWSGLMARMAAVGR